MTAELKRWSSSDFTKYLDQLEDDARPAVIDKVTAWSVRGDTALVYENHDLGHPDQGHVILLSYGSEDATVSVSAFPEPPTFLPVDLGLLAWRYVLVATYDPSQGVDRAHR